VIISNQLFIFVTLVDMVVSIAGAVTVRVVVVEGAGIHLLDNAVGKAEEG
jgi:hypothetical protein